MGYELCVKGRDGVFDVTRITHTHTHTHAYTRAHAHALIASQPERKTGRQADRQTGRQAGRQTDRQGHTHTHTQHRQRISSRLCAHDMMTAIRTERRSEGVEGFRFRKSAKQAAQDFYSARPRTTP